MYMMSNSATRNGGGDLVLDDLDLDPVADRLGAVLDRLDPADVEPDRGVELQRAAAGGRLRVAEHDADLLAQLVGEDERGVRAGDGAGQLAQRLAHQARLQAHVRVAHLAFDLGARHERGHRVDHDTSTPPERTSVSAISSACSPVSGWETSRSSTLTPQARGVAGIERVLGVDEGARRRRALRLGDDVQAERRLARRLPGRRSR